MHNPTSLMKHSAKPPIAHKKPNISTTGTTSCLPTNGMITP